MLAHRTDMPMTQLSQYPPGQPPFMPPVQTHPQIMQLVPYITTELMNEMAQKAYTNPARMFVYNVMSENNWQNHNFVDLIQLAANTVALNMINGAMPNPQQGFIDTVSNVLAMVTSKHIAELPELRSMCDPSVVNSAQQNVQVFRNLLQELSAKQMAIMGQGMPMQPMGHPMGYNATPMQPMGGPANYGRPAYGGVPNAFTGAVYGGAPQPSGHIDRWQTNRSAAQTTTSSPLFTRQPASPVDQTAFFKQHGVTEATPSAELASGTAKSAPEPMSACSSTWRPTEDQPYKFLVDTNRFTENYTNENGVVRQTLTLKENTMDRSAHELLNPTITAMQSVHNLAGVIRHEEVENAAVELVANIDSTELPECYMTSTWMLETFLADALLCGRIRKVNHEKKTSNPCKIYRIGMALTNPVVVDGSMSELMQKLSAASSFEDLARKIKSLAAAASGGELMDNPSSVSQYLIRADQFMTKLINDFIAKKLSIPKVDIDLFSEDYSAVGPYLEKKFGAKYVMALKQFEQDVLPLLFKEMDEAEYSALVDSLEAPGLGYIQELVTLTYVDLYDAELNLKIPAGESLLVTVDMHPMLYRIIESLYMQAQGVKTLKDYLVTQDDVVYEIHRGYMVPGAVLISKM